MISKGVLALIDAERQRQEYDLKYASSHDDAHGPMEWIILLGKQLGDMAHNAWQRHNESYSAWIGRVERPLVQLVAVGVAALETFARNRADKSAGREWPDDPDPGYTNLPWPIQCPGAGQGVGCAAPDFLAHINIKRSVIDGLTQQLDHAGKLMDEQRWWLDRKSREVVLLRQELAGCVDSLEYVERNLPNQSGNGVRQTRIGKAKVLLAKISPETT